MSKIKSNQCEPAGAAKTFTPDPTSDQKPKCFRDIMDLVLDLSDEEWKNVSRGMRKEKVTRLEFAAACTKIVTAVSSAVVLRLLKPLSKNFGIEAILEANDKLRKMAESKSRKWPASGTIAQGFPVEASDFICHLGQKIVMEIKGAMLEAIRSMASQPNGSMQVSLRGEHPILKLEELSMACTNEICDRILALYLSEELGRPAGKKRSEMSLKSQQEVQGIMKGLEKVVSVSRSLSSTASSQSDWFFNPPKVMAPACASTAAQTEKPLSDEYMSKASQVVSEVLLKTEQKLAALMSAQNSVPVCSETDLNILMELAKSTATEILQKLFLKLVQSLNEHLSATSCSDADQSEQEHEQKFVSDAQQIHRDIRKRVFDFFCRRKQAISEKSKTLADACPETSAEPDVSSSAQESPEQFLGKATRVASDILLKRLNSHILTGLISVKTSGSSTKQSVVASVDMEQFSSDNENKVDSEVALEIEVTGIENGLEIQKDDKTNVQQLIDAETNPQPSVQSSSFVPLPLFTVVRNQLKAFITSFSRKSAKPESDEDRVVPICISDDGLVYELTELHIGQSLSDSALGRRKIMLTSIPFPSEFIYIFVDESIKALLKNVLNTGSSDEDSGCSPHATEDQENNKNEGVPSKIKKKKKKKKSRGEDELTTTAFSDLDSSSDREQTASRSIFRNLRKALGRFCSKSSTKCPQSENPINLSE